MRAHSLTCTFCRKSEHEVRKLVAGPGVYICDACVELAYKIVSEAGEPPAPQPWWRRVMVRIRSLFESVARLLDRSAVSLGTAPNDPLERAGP